MRLTRALPVIVVGLLAAAGLAACDATTGLVLPARHASVLRPLRDESGWRYTLDSVTSCNVTDAISLVRVVGDQPVRIQSVTARYANGQAPSGDASFTVVAMPAASAWGYAGATATAPTLRGGRPTASVGAVLSPERTSHRAYALVLHVRLLPNAPAWGVRALSLRYKVGSSSRTSSFRQFLAVPATGVCNGP